MLHFKWVMLCFWNMYCVWRFFPFDLPPLAMLMNWLNHLQLLVRSKNRRKDIKVRLQSALMVALKLFHIIFKWFLLLQNKSQFQPSTVDLCMHAIIQMIIIITDRMDLAQHLALFIHITRCFKRFRSCIRLK